MTDYTRRGILEVAVGATSAVAVFGGVLEEEVAQTVDQGLEPDEGCGAGNPSMNADAPEYEPRSPSDVQSFTATSGLEAHCYE